MLVCLAVVLDDCMHALLFLFVTDSTELGGNRVFGKSED